MTTPGMHTPSTGAWSPASGGQLNFGAAGSGPISAALINLLGQSAQNQLFSSAGFVHNQFVGTQSFHDQQLSNQFAQLQLKAVTDAAKRDRDAMRAALGDRADSASGKRVMSIVSELSAQGSYVNPDLIDQLHGSQGSSAVMAHHSFNALRYMRDRSGRSFNMEDAGDFSANVRDRLYGRNAVDMNGIGAGRAGQMFDEMSRSGMMNGPADVESVSRRLQDMSKAVSAVRDLFGANGKSNAPMKELMDGLRSLTQGGSDWMSGSDSGMLIRRIHGLTRNVQGGLDRYMLLSRQGGALASSVGLDQSFGMQTATSSMAFGKAFGQLAGRQGFGGLSMDEATALDQQLRTAASGSNVANTLGGFLEMSEQGMFRDPTSDAARLAADLRSKDPAARQRAMTYLARIPAGQMRGQLQEMAQAAGVGGSTATTFFTAGQANQASVFRHGLGDMVRDLQGAGEISSVANSAFQGGAMGVLGEAGFNQQEMQQILPVVSNVIQQTMSQMDGDLISNPDRAQERNAILANAVTQAIGPAASARIGPRINEMIGSAVKSLETRISRDPNLKKFKNAAGLFSMNNRNVMNAGKQEINQADKEAKDASRSSGTSVESPIRRIVDAIIGMGSDKKENALSVIARTLGGVDARQAALLGLGSGAVQGGGGGGGGGAGPGPVRIEGRLTLQSDGTVNLDGTTINTTGAGGMP